MNHFSNMGRFFDDASKVVDDLVAVECQLYSEYFPKLNAAAASKTIEKPKLSSIIPTKKIKQPHLPKQIPPCQRKSKSKSLPPNPVKKMGSPKDRALSPPLSTPVQKALKQEFNPFLTSDSETETEEDSGIPLTMYSLFQFPLETTSIEITPQSLPDLVVEVSDTETENSADDDSMSSSPPPPFMVFHQAAFKSYESSLNLNHLTPEFKLHYARDKVIASLDPEKAYFLKYANELVTSRASISSSKNSSNLFSPNPEVTVRDLHGICMSLSASDLATIIEKRTLYNSRFDNYSKGRDLRPNSAGWRILASEFSMIYAKKIVRPLKPRAYLPKKVQEFTRSNDYLL
ncbi:hypothetical protein K502DRAFT_352302 [Neoconidiobolus thromboides FSU 785]|nr:hypothetical protein K502DRAFT_352302 [Neoconidiobolus thromboides FSU 785]